MNLSDFFIKWNGKFCQTGSFPGQCVNIAKEYMVNFLGLPEFKGNAIDYWNKNVPGFIKIKKNYLNRPLPGDIVVFNYGILGHVGICNWTTLYQIQCFEQNNPVGSPCHFQTHLTYWSIIGWLRPIKVVDGLNSLNLKK
jgi:hypothetical protein